MGGIPEVGKETAVGESSKNAGSGENGRKLQNNA